MICPNGHENSDDQAFCGTCGAPLRPQEDEGLPVESGSAQADQRSLPQKLGPLVLIAYGALGAAFLGSFLPWARVLFVTLNGTDGDGNITAVASAGAALCLGFATRQEPVSKRLLLGALALSVLCAGVYLYDANELTRTVEDAGIFGELRATPQLGLYLGTFGAILAVGAIGMRALRAYRPGVLGDLPTATIGALIAGLYAVTLAVVPGWWGLAGVAAVIALALGIWQRRQAADTGRPVRPATAALVAGAIGVVGAVGGAVIDNSGGTSAASCSEVFADGATTEAAWEEDNVVCEDEDGSRTFVLTYEAFCLEADEAPLVNEFGWGHVGEPWHAGEDAPDC